MKELSIEEKAKAYDGNYKAYTELINRLEDAKEAIKKQNYGNAMDILCMPYPWYQITTSTELKESEDSEDEKTRTKLLNLLKELLELGGVAQDTWSMNDCERFIAWLEKQGEQTEAQAENNLPSFDEAQGTIIVEKQGGQKSTDKVEPKFNFKVGQWIVATGKCVYLIAKIDGFNVTLVDTNGDEYVFDASLLNDAYQWTIQDAKDGDVLCYKDEISLYKHDIKNCTKQGTTFGGFVYHCCYDGKRFITDSLYSLTEQDKMDIHPATQEQRSLLFQKMREAGYEWDDEKKALKKIEGEFNGEDYGIDSLWHAQNILERTLGKVDGYQSDDGILEHKCAITAVKKLYKQKSVEWSWMDKQHLSSIIKMVEHCSFSSIGGITKAAAVDWLKFLKDRIQPQPKQ